MLDHFEEKKSRLLSAMEAMQVIANDRGMKDTFNRLTEMQKKLVKSTFLIAAFGGFSSGKSTFLNALVGEKLFPSLHTPTTASINFLSWGPKSEVEVHYKTKDELEENQKSGAEEYKNPNFNFSKLGKTEKFEIQFLQELSRENNDSIYIRDISISYPSEKLLPEGVLWIDTPGTDSIVEYHRSITYSLIEKADAILFFIFAPIPFKNSDWSFLEDIKNIRKALKSDKFFFIVNAIDGIEDQSPEEIIAFIRRQLEKKAMIDSPKMISVSSKLALLSRRKEASGLSPNEDREYKRMLLSYTDKPESINTKEAFRLSGFENLEKEISTFLHNEKATVLLQGNLERIYSVREDIERDIHMEKVSATKSVEELNSLIQDKLIPDLNHRNDKLREIIESLKRNLSSIVPDFSQLELDVGNLIESRIQSGSKPEPKDLEKIFHNIIFAEKKKAESRISESVQNAYPEIYRVFSDFNKSLFSEFQLNVSFRETLDYSAIAKIDYSENLEFHHKRIDRDDAAIGGALVGGILALLVPGGLGFFAGALLGGLAGHTIAGEYGERVENKIRDVLGIKKKAVSSIQPQMESVKREFNKILGEYKISVVNSIQTEAENRISELKRDLFRMQEKRELAEKDKVLTEKLLSEQLLKLQTATLEISEK